MITVEKNLTAPSLIDMGVQSTLPEDKMYPKEFTELETLLKSPRSISVFRRFRSVLAKRKYQLWLLLLRETSILKELMLNYEKIPKRTPTYRIVTLFVKSSLLKTLLLATDKRLRKRLY